MTLGVLINDNRSNDDNPHAESRYTAWVESHGANDWVEAANAESLETLVGALCRYALECTDGWLQTVGAERVRVLLPCIGFNPYLNLRCESIADPINYWAFSIVSPIVSR